MLFLGNNAFAEKMGLILLFSIFTIIMGCETGLQDRLTKVENELSDARSEISATRDELSTVEGELLDSEEALRECQASGLGILIVENDYTGGSVKELYISPVTSDEWGGQWLGAPIPSFTWRHFGLEPGTYDIKAVFSNNTELESERTINPGEFTTQRYF